MPAANNPIVFDIKYTANNRSELVRNVIFNGLKLREADGCKILSVQSFENHKHFSIEVNAVEWVRIKGKVRKLRAPREQSQVREAELKFLLQGKREGLSDPSLRSYEMDEIIQSSRRDTGFFGWILGGIALIFLSLPGLVTLGLLGVCGYTFYIMMNHVH